MKPILFNTDMVRAILDGRKVVTRRAVKSHIDLSKYRLYELHDNADGRITVSRNKLCAGFYTDGQIFFIDGRRHIDAFYFTAPYKPGDILYVRETWAEMPYGIVYRADEEEPEGWDDDDRWRPSIHMPKEAARIFLKVTDVIVERLQEMGAQDSLYEGVKLSLEGITKGESPLRPFADIWDSTIPKKDLERYGWSANPWVWVITFERTGKPV